MTDQQISTGRMTHQCPHTCPENINVVDAVDCYVSGYVSRVGEAAAAAMCLCDGEGEGAAKASSVHRVPLNLYACQPQA